jgi:cell wall-associated NlpC family hydrolase
MSDLTRAVADRDSDALIARALRRRQHYQRAAHRPVAISAAFTSRARQLIARPGIPSSRFLLHLIVGLLVPFAIVASQLPMVAPFVAAPPLARPFDPSSDVVVPVSPIGLDDATGDDTPVPDAAFDAIDALPATTWRPDLLKEQPIAVLTSGDTTNMRSGPGTDYDKVGELPAGTSVQLLAQANGWYQARLDNGRIAWITAELLDLTPQVTEAIPPAASIPAPPPARVGLVAQEGLNLRDGPGTAYVGMTKLSSGSQLDLLARYDDWFQVQTSAGQVGWVLSQFLTTAPGVADRVDRVTSVPSPNPALQGRTTERSVNLRGGPGVAYPQIGRLGTDTKLDLLGRYQDWMKVRTPDGASGWISNELVEVSDFIARRVPAVRDIPALPRPAPAAAPQARERPRAAQALPAPGASAGDAVGFATQFVGSSYVWGGASPDGFDCSGFTQYVYKQFGLSMPHSSAGQYSTRYGTIVSNPADLRPGDLVFFANTYKRGISHVGIYVGGGDVVQALSPKQGVGVANINGGYWAQHYYGGIRPSN